MRIFDPKNERGESLLTEAEAQKLFATLKIVEDGDKSTLAAAVSYADAADGTVIAEAMSYTDSEVSEVITALDTHKGDSTAHLSSSEHSGLTGLIGANLDSRVTALENQEKPDLSQYAKTTYVDEQDVAQLAAAQSFASEHDAETLASAQTYADTKVGEVSSQLTTHTGDTTAHLSSSDRTTFNSLASGNVISRIGTLETNQSNFASKSDLTNHTGDSGIHLTEGEKTWLDSSLSGTVNIGSSGSYVKNSGGGLVIAAQESGPDLPSAAAIEMDCVTIKFNSTGRPLWNGYYEIAIKDDLNGLPSKDYVDTADSQTLAEAMSYADEADGNILAEANSYSDSIISTHANNTEIHLTSTEHTSLTTLVGADLITRVKALEDKPEVDLTDYAKKEWVTGELTTHTGNSNIHLTEGEKTFVSDAVTNRKVALGNGAYVGQVSGYRGGTYVLLTAGDSVDDARVEMNCSTITLAASNPPVYRDDEGNCSEIVIASDLQDYATKDYADNKLVQAQSYADENDSIILAAAQSYTNAQTTATLSEAKNYTNTHANNEGIHVTSTEKQNIAKIPSIDAWATAQQSKAPKKVTQALTNNQVVISSEADWVVTAVIVSLKNNGGRKQASADITYTDTTITLDFGTGASETIENVEVYLQYFGS